MEDKRSVPYQSLVYPIAVMTIRSGSRASRASKLVEKSPATLTKLASSMVRPGNWNPALASGNQKLPDPTIG